MEAAVRQSEELGNSKCSAYFKSMEAHSDHCNGMCTPELNMCLVDRDADRIFDYNSAGLCLGNQNLSTDLLAWSPRNIMGGLIEQGDTNR
eukprot:3020716-Heterocapsa_arctica.AAC.1